MSSFAAALEAEIVELQNDIRDRPDPRLKKLDDLLRVRAAHYAGDGVSPAAPKFKKAEIAQDMQVKESIFERFLQTNARAPGRKRSPEREAALREAELFLAGKTEPVKTAEIFELLQFKGIQITGEDPKSNLSAMLSNAEQFQSHGRAGWTLATVGGRVD